MARDDYFVIVYQVLKYLYDCLKKGEKPEKALLNEDEYSIPKRYWEYVLLSLLEEGYIQGIRPINTKSGIAWGNIEDVIITPKGIEYFFENSMIQKVKKTLKDVKDIVPGL